MAPKGQGRGPWLAYPVCTHPPTSVGWIVSKDVAEDEVKVIMDSKDLVHTTEPLWGLALA